MAAFEHAVILSEAKDLTLLRFPSPTSLHNKSGSRA